MSDLFEEGEDDLLDEEVVNVENIEEDAENVDDILDARRRLENRLEEKRLRDELDDFVDY